MARDGIDGLPGLDGFDGKQGPRGLSGAAGATGPAGPSGGIAISVDDPVVAAQRVKIWRQAWAAIIVLTLLIIALGAAIVIVHREVAVLDTNVNHLIAVQSDGIERGYANRAVACDVLQLQQPGVVLSVSCTDPAVAKFRTTTAASGPTSTP